ncbi:hypothetical protein AMTRI_Chr09g20020 [Amborella trichopoda]
MLDVWTLQKFGSGSNLNYYYNYDLSTRFLFESLLIEIIAILLVGILYEEFHSHMQGVNPPCDRLSASNKRTSFAIHSFAYNPNFHQNYWKHPYVTLAFKFVKLFDRDTALSKKVNPPLKAY